MDDLGGHILGLFAHFESPSKCSVALDIEEEKLSIDKINLSLYRLFMRQSDWVDATAERLAMLYDDKFGGKDSGRYRISNKIVREMAKRRRLYEEDVRALTRALFEKGFVLIDMDNFFVVMSANAFVNYRRANEDCLA